MVVNNSGKSAYADRLESAMRDANVSDAQLADHLRLSIQAVRKLLRGGSHAFTAENTAEAAAFLEVDFYWLATGKRRQTIDAAPGQAPLMGVSDQSELSQNATRVEFIVPPLQQAMVMSDLEELEPAERATRVAELQLWIARVGEVAALKRRAKAEAEQSKKRPHLRVAHVEPDHQHTPSSEPTDHDHIKSGRASKQRHHQAAGGTTRGGKTR